MPFTPYHFGINALPGLASRGRLDILILIAANVFIDIEVLADKSFDPGWPVHQLWHFHTLLIGGLVGVVLGTIVYTVKPLRYVCRWFNSLLGFSHSPTLLSMILSGILGAWLHVLVDGLFHSDVQVFWPVKTNLLMRWISSIPWLRLYFSNHGVIRICILGLIVASMLFAFLFYRHFITLKKENSARRNTIPE